LTSEITGIKIETINVYAWPTHNRHVSIACVKTNNRNGKYFELGRKKMTKINACKMEIYQTGRLTKQTYLPG
jgi:hypothetical protein